MFKTVVKLAGVSFPNQDGSSRQEVLGDLFDDFWTEDLEDEIKLELRREPENDHDSNAVAVYLVEPEHLRSQLGYVPRETSRTVSAAIEEGRFRKVSLKDMGCSRGNRLWAKIEIQIRGEDDSPEDPFEGSEFFEDDDGNTYRIVG